VGAAFELQPGGARGRRPVPTMQAAADLTLKHNGIP